MLKIGLPNRLGKLVEQRSAQWGEYEASPTLLLLVPIAIFAIQADSDQVSVISAGFEPYRPMVDTTRKDEH